MNTTARQREQAALPAVDEERPARSPERPTPAAAVLALQQDAGNAAVARALLRQTTTPAPAPAVTPVGPPDAPPLRKLPKRLHIELGDRFDLDYTPTDPLPAEGVVTVTLKIHVKFKDFDRAMMRRKEFVKHRWTKAQLGQFAWPQDKRDEWVGKFSRLVADGWGGKHVFVLDTPGVEKYRATCRVVVQHVDDPAQANNVITAQWVPPGAPRLRSSVSGDRTTSELDARDTEEPTRANVDAYAAVRQIGPFEHDSDNIADVARPIADFVAMVKRQREPGGPLAGPADQVFLSAGGRASAKGDPGYNLTLSGRRASKVMDKVAADTGLDTGITISHGAQNATEDPVFRRVDMMVSAGGRKDVTQMTAVHEAGHMFGLGDEYVDESPGDKRFAPQFGGEQPTHHGAVEATLGTEAADDLIKHQSDSIMSQGSVVKPGHYVPFLLALNSVTGETWGLQ